MGVARFVVKASLVGGIAYYTVQQGLWSNSEDSVQLYGKIYNNVTPYIKDNIPKEMMNELPLLPNAGDICNSVKSSWNTGIIASMKFLSETPSHVTNGVRSLSKTVGQYMQQQSVPGKGS